MCLPLAKLHRVLSTDEGGRFVPVGGGVSIVVWAHLEPMVRCPARVWTGRILAPGPCSSKSETTRTQNSGIFQEVDNRQTRSGGLTAVAHLECTTLTCKSTFTLATRRLPSFYQPSRERHQAYQVYELRTVSNERSAVLKKTGFKILEGGDGKGTNNFEG